ncbi:MAG TPA: hypothetical protein PLQ52_03625, partial [Lacunisphaera sp.]|nr:hypothetical protein [Lacunisphaera sp.]
VVLNSVVISQLRAQEATVARQLADYQNRYGEAHPAIANVRAELADIRSQITAETRRIHSRFQSGQDGRARFGPGDIPIFRFRLTAQLCRDQRWRMHLEA